jgi:hypothetical protein
VSSICSFYRSYCLRFDVRVRFLVALGMGRGSLDDRKGCRRHCGFLYCFLYAGIYSVCTSFHEAGKIIAAVHILFHATCAVASELAQVDYCGYVSSSACPPFLNSLELSSQKIRSRVSGSANMLPRSVILTTTGLSPTAPVRDQNLLKCHFSFPGSQPISFGNRDLERLEKDE